MSGNKHESAAHMLLNSCLGDSREGPAAIPSAIRKILHKACTGCCCYWSFGIQTQFHSLYDVSVQLICMSTKKGNLLQLVTLAYGQSLYTAGYDIPGWFDMQVQSRKVTCGHLVCQHVGGCPGPAGWAPGRRHALLGCYQREGGLLSPRSHPIALLLACTERPNSG